jgi:hypothetical protein
MKVMKKDDNLTLVMVRHYCYACNTKVNRARICVNGIIRKDNCKICGEGYKQVILTEEG